MQIHDILELELVTVSVLRVRKMVRVLRLILGLLFVIGGSIVVFISVVAFVEPVGTKHADDGDPFGTPPSRLESAAIASSGFAGLLVGLFLAGGAFGLTRRGEQSRGSERGSAKD